jgi:hypothetical protein
MELSLTTTSSDPLGEASSLSYSPGLELSLRRWSTKQPSTSSPCLSLPQSLPLPTTVGLRFSLIETDRCQSFRGSVHPRCWQEDNVIPKRECLVCDRNEQLHHDCIVGSGVTRSANGRRVGRWTGAQRVGRRNFRKGHARPVVNKCTPSF